MKPDTIAELQSALFEFGGNSWPMNYIRADGWSDTEDGYIVKYEGRRDFSLSSKPIFRSYSFKRSGDGWSCVELRPQESKKGKRR